VMRWGFRPGRGAPVRRGSSRSPTSYQVPPRLPAGSVAAGCPARWPSGLLTAGTPAASQAPRSRRLVAGRQGESESCRIEDLDLVEAVQEGGAGSADELGEPLNRQKVTPSVVSIFVTSHSSSRTMTTEPGAIAVALNITCVLSVVPSFRLWRRRYPGLKLVGDLCRETVLHRVLSEHAGNDVLYRACRRCGYLARESNAQPDEYRGSP
jgi:hypothetical protein